MHEQVGAALEVETSRKPITRGAALFALAVLFSMNLLNYIDRYVFAAVGPALMKDLQLESYWFGFLGTSFIIVYTIVSPIVGWLGDRQDRRRLLAFGVGLWSVATIGTAFATDFDQMLLARALLGVGEASYGVVAPTLLADLFSVKRRGRVMGVFYLALPLGTAFGYGVGGLIDAKFGWHAAFLVVGLPGLLLAFAGLMIVNPVRGASEARTSDRSSRRGEGNLAAVDPSTDASETRPAPRPTWADYLGLVRNRTFLFNTAGMAAVTFTTGAFGHWMPTFYQRVRGMPKENQIQIGAALAAAGIIGVLIGMRIPDRLLKVTPRAYLIWAGVAVLLAIPFGIGGLLVHSLRGSIVLMFFASVFLTSCLGPCNAVTANVVPANQRSVGFAASIFMLHLVGDVPSPPLIGALADRFARGTLGASRFARFLERLGATPIVAHHGPTNLTAGMLLIVPVLLIGGICFLAGSRSLVRDQNRARELGGTDRDRDAEPIFH